LRPRHLNDNEGVGAGKLPDSFRQSIRLREAIFLLGLKAHDGIDIGLMKL
jgi:hypothetical protein